MEIIGKMIANLTPSDNPRVHPPDQIERLVVSIREFGWTIPVLIDENDRIIAGHGRVEATRRQF